MKLENLLIGFLLLVLITIGGRVVAGDTQEALDVAAEKGLTDLSPSEPELGIVFAVIA